VIAPPSKIAQPGRTFTGGTREFEAFRDNVLQRQALSSGSPPAFCFAEWNTQELRVFALSAGCRYGGPTFAEGFGGHASEVFL
jgi:hypothetical protein